MGPAADGGVTPALAVLSGPLIVGATAVGLGVALLPPEQAVSAMALVIRTTKREIRALSTEVNLAYLGDTPRPPVWGWRPLHPRRPVPPYVGERILGDTPRPRYGAAAPCSLAGWPLRSRKEKGDLGDTPGPRPFDCPLRRTLRTGAGGAPPPLRCPGGATLSEFGKRSSRGWPVLKLANLTGGGL